MNEKHNTVFSCGCVKELENNNGVWQPTGKKEECKKHKGK